MDFYDYVEPSSRDEIVRRRLIERIERVLAPAGAGLPSESTIRCFGSFPAKMYLPTADMDLVLVTKQRLNGATQSEVQRFSNNLMHRIKRTLMLKHIAVNPTVISRARVQLIKFEDSQSGIKVDLSFENLSGIVAQETFQDWTAKEAHMFPMVALIKQFLVMRGLSDVHTGGIGGFTIICLAYTYLRMNASTHSQDDIVNLAKLFMGFLDFWGNRFDLATQRLQMNFDPPRIVPKVSIG